MHFIHLDTYILFKIHFKTKQTNKNMKQQKNNSNSSDVHIYVNV